jgi:hypothetical protein
MPNTKSYIPDDSEFDSMTSGETSLAVIEEEAAPQEATEWTGPRCEKCEAPLKSDVVTVCRKCGWYGSLGMFVEVDPNWETETERSPQKAAPQPTSHVKFWINLIPRWGWLVIGSAFAVVVESVIARFVTPEGSSIRTIWSLTQLAIGAAAVAGCHMFNFVSLAADDPDIGMLDLLLKPLRLWGRMCQHLPKRLWLFNSLVCGITAVVMSLAVIGGLPYERLWDWGFKEPPKQNLMGAVMDRAKQLEGEEKSLEEAIGDFAGKAGVDEDTNKANEPPDTRQKTDCVILGYEIDRDGRLATLYLGAAHRKKLAFAGRVTPKLTEAEAQKLIADLKQIVIKQPFITIQADQATWVKPKLACRVKFGKQTSEGLLRDMEWDSLLTSMRTGK